MNTREALSLMRWLEATHAPLSHPGWLMGELRSIVGIPGCVVNRIRDQLSMCDPIALMFSPESPGVLGTEFDLPESNEFVGDRDPSLGQ
jgi:hypothetical protein